MSHKQNLIPGGHKLTPEEMSRGGINGARSRKERKQVQELARAILDMPLHDGFIIDAEDLPSLNDIDSANVDVKTKVIATLAVKALNGNVRATQTLFTLTGDYTTRQEAIIDVESPLYDPDRTEYIQTINVHVNGKPGDDESPGKPCEVRYFDYQGNLVKVIYGEEAERLIELHYEDQHDKGIPIQFEIVIDEEDDDEIPSASQIL